MITMIEKHYNAKIGRPKLTKAELKKREKKLNLPRVGVFDMFGKTRLQ